MPRSSHGQSSRPPSSQRSSGRSRKSTRPPHSRDSSTILPSTIQPTTFPSTMSEPASASRRQFKQYTPSCNAFEHMNTLKETVDYWTDATKSHLTANQAKRQRDLASIVNTYAQTAGTATDVKQDLAKTTHTALKGMYWVYKNAAESGTGESKRVLTDACKEINSLFGQSEVKDAQSMAFYIDKAQASRQNTIARKVFDTARSAAGWTYDFLFKGDNTSTPTTFIPDSRAHGSHTRAPFTPSGHNATMTEDGHWIVPDQQSTYTPSTGGGAGLFWKGASALGTLGLAGISAAATAVSSASAPTQRLLGGTVSAIGNSASAYGQGTGRLLGSHHGATHGARMF